MKTRLTLTLLLVFQTYLARAYDWTYMCRVSQPGGSKVFFLWIPENAPGIRGVIMTAKARISQLSGDSTIRNACRDRDLGIMGCPDLDGNFNPADTVFINEALSQFATLSGFPELQTIPLASYGTSVGGIFAWEVAFAYKSRFFGIIEDNAVYTTIPAWAGSGASLTGIPIVLSRGYNEPVTDPSWLSTQKMLELRAQGGLATVLLKAGGGHFAWTNWEARYLANWLKKAVDYRIPAGYFREGPPQLLSYPQESGWLSDTTYTAATIAAASYENYSGSKENALWHFDQELAQQWLEMHQGQFQRSSQVGGFSNNNLENCTNPWQLCSPVLNYFESPTIVPGASTNAGLPVRYGIYNGPFRLEGNTIVPDPNLHEDGNRGWIVAIQEGSATHQAWERAVSIRVDRKTSGQSQTITFSPLADVADTVAPFSWTATSTSGLAVNAWIKSGPAELEGNTIRIKPFGGDSGAKALVIIRYSHPGSFVYQTATTVADSFWVTKTTPAPTRVGKKQFGPEGRLFPNPTGQKVSWIGDEIHGDVRILDVSGRLLETLPTSRPEWDLRHLAPGLYYVEIPGGKGLTRKKLIRQ